LFSQRKNPEKYITGKDILSTTEVKETHPFESATIQHLPITMSTYCNCRQKLT